MGLKQRIKTLEDKKQQTDPSVYIFDYEPSEEEIKQLPKNSVVFIDDIGVDDDEQPNP
ncbi:hypothetical protein NHG32_07295 [Aerococcaceae bacterium NML191219]|nr:hypothetical protein [Aerococcaceae bacterium NML191219]